MGVSVAFLSHIAIAQQTGRGFLRPHIRKGCFLFRGRVLLQLGNIRVKEKRISNHRAIGFLLGGARGNQLAMVLFCAHIMERELVVMSSILSTMQINGMISFCSPLLKHMSFLFFLVFTISQPVSIAKICMERLRRNTGAPSTFTLSCPITLLVGATIASVGYLGMG